MKLSLVVLLLVFHWSLVTSKDDSGTDASHNSTASGENFPELSADADRDVEMPFDFLTIQQSIAAPENGTEKDEGLLSVAQMNFHAKLVETLARTQVEKFGASWTLADFCYKQHLHKPNDKVSEQMYTLLERAFPCNVVSPLDCFVEGGLVHGPYPPVYLGKKIAELRHFSFDDLEWTSFDPENFWTKLGLYGRIGRNYNLIADSEELLETFEKLSIRHGYAQKFCLDPENMRCPKEAQNKNNAAAAINIGSILGEGCSGIIESVMDWQPNLFLDGYVQNSPGGPIVSAESLSTTILISNASHVFNKISNHPGIKPGLDEVAFTNEGIEGVAALMSEWSNKTFEVLQNLAQTNGVGGASVDFSPDVAWIEESKVHEKLVQSAKDGTAVWEQILGSFEKFEWLLNKQ